MDASSFEIVCNIEGEACRTHFMCSMATGISLASAKHFSKTT